MYCMFSWSRETHPIGLNITSVFTKVTVYLTWATASQLMSVVLILFVA